MMWQLCVRGVMMRVIAGSAKGRQLKAPPTMGTRPMTDRLKTSLFDTLTPFGIAGARVLDLYAGSGSLGIEWRPRGNLLNAQPFVRGDFAYVGEVVTNLEGFESVTAQAAVTTQDAYETGDLRVGLDGDRWSGSLFVRNVWDERAVTFRSNRWAVPRLSIIQPRTYGVEFQYRF